MNHINYAILLLSKRIRAHTDKTFFLPGAQHQALHYLCLHPDGLSSSQLCGHMGCSYPTMSGIVKRLACQDYVQTKPNPEDKRSSIIVATEKGLALESRLQASMNQFEEIFTQPLSDEEKEQLRHLLYKLLDAHRKETLHDPNYPNSSQKL